MYIMKDTKTNLISSCMPYRLFPVYSSCPGQYAGLWELHLSVALKAVPSERGGWKTDLLGAREEGVLVCFFKETTAWAVHLDSKPYGL